MAEALLSYRALVTDIKTDGMEWFVVSCIMWTLGWLILFHLVRWVQPLWLKRLPRSSKVHEDDENWCARNVLGILHAIFIASLSVPSFFAFLDAPDEVRFAAAPHLADCALDKSQGAAMPWNSAGKFVALAGLAFTTFTIADIFLSVFYGLNALESRRGLDHLVHHAAFITVGLMVRTNCMLPFNAAILLSMEVSTPFLNYCTLMMNRGKSFSRSTTFAGLIFVFLFLVVRIFLNTWGVMFLWVNEDIAMPARVQDFEFWFLLVAIIAGALVQYVWLFVILRKFREHWTNISQDSVLIPAARKAIAQDGAHTNGSVPVTALPPSSDPETSKQPAASTQEKQPGACFQGACNVS